MVDIRPQDLNPAVTPIDADSPIIIDQGLSGVNRTTSTEMVNSVAPVASQSEAEVGTDDVNRMTALKTKQSIASEVGVSVASYASGQAGLSAVQSVNGKTGNAVTIDKSDVGLGNVDNTSDANKPISTAMQTALDDKANESVEINSGTGLVGGGDLSESRTIELDSDSIASLSKADSAVQPDRSISSGAGLTGGGTLASNRTIALSSVSIASLAKADTAVQSVNGKTGSSVTLAKTDVGLGNVDNTSDANKPISTATQAALSDKFNNPTGTTSQYIRGDGSVAAFPAIPQGTVTSVGMSVPTGLSLAGSPITTSGSFSVSYASGYQGYTTAEANKLAGIAAGAQVNTVNSVAGKTGAITLVKADVGLGNVDNTSDANKPVSTATQNALNAKANSAVTITAGTGLTGGGNLTENRSVSLNAASIASLAKADTALQALGGLAGQVLTKSSDGDNDVEWVTSEAATAVSYGPQVLTEPQQKQARKNIGLDDVWSMQPIGVPIPIFLNSTGVNLPPKDKDYRYVLLSAGQTGAGQYNAGILTGESVSGSAPLITAKAIISLAGSPMNGAEIHLINTSKFFLRAGTSEIIEAGQNESHNHTGSTGADGVHSHTGSTNNTGGHTHTVPILMESSGPGGGDLYTNNRDTKAGNTTTSSAGAHSHSVTINNSASHTHTVSINASGGNEARPRNLNIQYIMRVA